MLDALVAPSRRTLTAPAIAAALGLHGLVLLATLVRPAPPEIEIEPAPKGPPVLIFRHDAAPGAARSAERPVRSAPPKKPTHTVRPSLRPRPAVAVAAPPEPVSEPVSEPTTAEPPDEPGEGPAGNGPAGPSCEPHCAPSGPSRGGIDEVPFDAPNLVRPRPACFPRTPQMPEQARLLGITGAVVVRYAVAPDGQVSDVRILTPSSPPVLIEAVRSWLTGCEFQPAAVQGRPVQVHVTQPFVFKIQ